MSRQLKATPLTAEQFAPFGQVIDRSQHSHFLINSGTTERYHRMAQVDTGPDDGQAIISIFRKPKADQFPLSIAMLERHPHGSQAFIPLRGKPFLIVVAPAGDRPDPQQMRLFISNGQQGVNYAPGVWHHPLIVTCDEDELLVVDRAGQLANCDEYAFDADQIHWIDWP
ncbi:MAG: ureidoglycolate lyase [Nitrincola lacisaponensis]|uniref:Ureidoglycolate hydrolase n=1 Tax=Nitrincola lacisaponensis TaxID=267850 RepID=A0A063Y3B8_9GAMM|nr:ureidoglycolate lyase [Nitrincola lacisaponensis]KDE40184.1 Ureidoglycolate hydrolase [Nitrincola lacisaponensis]